MAARLINENVDIHNRAYRLWAEASPTSSELIDIKLTSTFSGSVLPDTHRPVWDASLPKEAVLELIQELQKGLNG